MARPVLVTLLAVLLLAASQPAPGLTAREHYEMTLEKLGEVSGQIEAFEIQRAESPSLKQTMANSIGSLKLISDPLNRLIQGKPDGNEGRQIMSFAVNFVSDFMAAQGLVGVPIVGSVLGQFLALLFNTPSDDSPEPLSAQTISEVMAEALRSHERDQIIDVDGPALYRTMDTEMRQLSKRVQEKIATPTAQEYYEDTLTHMKAKFIDVATKTHKWYRQFATGLNNFPFLHDAKQCHAQGKNNGSEWTQDFHDKHKNAVKELKKWVKFAKLTKYGTSILDSYFLQLGTLWDQHNWNKEVNSNHSAYDDIKMHLNDIHESSDKLRLVLSECESDELTTQQCNSAGDCNYHELKVVQWPTYMLGGCDFKNPAPEPGWKDVWHCEKCDTEPATGAVYGFLAPGNFAQKWQSTWDQNDVNIFLRWRSEMFSGVWLLQGTCRAIWVRPAACLADTLQKVRIAKSTGELIVVDANGMVRAEASPDPAWGEEWWIIADPDGCFRLRNDRYKVYLSQFPHERRLTAIKVGLGSRDKFLIGWSDGTLRNGFLKTCNEDRYLRWNPGGPDLVDFEDREIFTFLPAEGQRVMSCPNTLHKILVDVQ